MSDFDGLLEGTSFEVAPRLLGAVIRHGQVAVRLTEVEAYAGATDPGSHAFRGETARNSVMFGAQGLLYCYLIYGMHVCANVVVGKRGDPAAVLLRAGEVIEGIDLARERRPRTLDRDLARGPANLCATLGIALTHNGTDLALGPIHLVSGERCASSAISAGPRVGLRQAAERPWRFWVSGHPCVSTYRPAPPLRPRE